MDSSSITHLPPGLCALARRVEQQRATLAAALDQLNAHPGPSREAMAEFERYTQAQLELATRYSALADAIPDPHPSLVLAALRGAAKDAALVLRQTAQDTVDLLSATAGTTLADALFGGVR